MDFIKTCSHTLGKTLLLGAIVAASHTQAQEKEVDLAHYGVFVKQGESYQAMSAYSHMRVDFEYLNKFPVVNGANENVELIIYQPDIYPNAFSYELRPVYLPGKVTSLEPKVKKLSDEQYQVTFDESVSEKDILMATYNYDQRYGVVFKDPATILSEHYSKQASTDQSPTTIAWQLEKSLKAFPENDTLKSLQTHWQDEALQVKATEHHDLINSAWAKYETADDAEAKLKSLKHVKKLSEDYLEKYPSGKDIKDVNKKLKLAQSKLDF